MDTRLLIDPPAAGAWNMAVDEVLLESAAHDGAATLRFYRWSEPTLSLGYFQDYASRARHLPSRNCPAVRRLTGGGAIVHDRELTYSLVLPAGHLLAAGRDRLYALVHASLVEALADLGIAAVLVGADVPRAAADEPFLCFQRRAPGDVLVGAAKVAGSAQRRRRGAVLQHGSVLLQRSAAAPELDGIGQLCGHALDEETLLAAWLPKLAAHLATGWCEGPLADRQRQRASAWVESRYAAESWTVARRADPSPARANSCFP
jgi:lipoate-protein ligase A